MSANTIELFRLPRHLVKILSGEDGRDIKKISSDFCVFIQFSPDKVFLPDRICTVKKINSESQVQSAVEFLKKNIEKLQKTESTIEAECLQQSKESFHTDEKVQTVDKVQAPVFVNPNYVSKTEHLPTTDRNANEIKCTDEVHQQISTVDESNHGISHPPSESTNNYDTTHPPSEKTNTCEYGLAEDTNQSLESTELNPEDLNAKDGNAEEQLQNIQTLSQTLFTDSDIDAQEDELMALRSIMDDEIFCAYVDEEDRGGWFYAHLHLPNNFYVILNNADGSSTEKHRVEHLPPIMLTFQLPDDYPSQQPPKFKLSAKWLTLTQIKKLCEKLDTIWQDSAGNVILFQWMSFLQDEIIDYLHLTSPLDLTNVLQKHRLLITHNNEPSLSFHDPRAIQDIASQSLLRSVVLDFNIYQQKVTFDKSHVICDICMCEKNGHQCTLLVICKHAFCNKCLTQYLTMQITETNVASITCPHGKCDSDILPSQVKQLVSSEVFVRYDRLLLQHSLETMVDIIQCPRLSCETPVLFDRESGMATCSLCYFVFCPFCKLTYHGIAPCRIQNRDVKALRDEYLSADATKRTIMERRYSKQVLDKIVHEAFSEDWLEQNSQKCPKCSTNIEKLDGCNKMTCTKCRSFFCWICNEQLSRNNPYDHYTNPNSPCADMLFHGAHDEFDDEDIEEADV